MTWVVFALFSIGYSFIAVFGTGTNLVFQWPGIAAIGMASVLSFAVRTRGASMASPMCLYATTALVIYICVRSLLSPVAILARSDAVLACLLFVAYLIFSQVIVGRRQRRVFVYILVLLGVANCVVAYYQMVADSTFHVVPGYDRNVDEGALPGGFFNIHPHLGGFLAIPCVFGIAYGVFGRGGPAGKLLVLFGASLSIAGVVLSSSRGGYVGIGVGLVGMLFLGLAAVRVAGSFRFHRSPRVVIAAGLVVLLGVACLAFIGLSERFGGKKKIAELLAPRGRQYYAQAALGITAEAPLFGKGAGSYRYEFYKHRPEEMIWHQANPKYTHNDYLQTTSEHGLVGLGLALAVVFSHLANGLRRIRGLLREGRVFGSDSFAIAGGAFVVVVTYAVLSLFDFNLRLAATGIPVAFALAILSRSHRPAPLDEAGGDHPVRDWVWRGTRLSFGAMLVVGAWLSFPADRKLEGAKQFIRGGEPDRAIPLLHEVIERREWDAEAHRNLGLVRFNAASGLPAVVGEQYVRGALEAYDRSIELHPGDWWTWAQTAECYTVLGEGADPPEREELWREAERRLDRAIELGPTMYKSHQQLSGHHLTVAFARALEGDTEGAVERVRLCMRSFDNVVRTYAWGGGYHRHRAIRRSALELLDVLGVSEEVKAEIAGDYPE